MNDLRDKFRDIHNELVELDGYLSGMKFNCCYKYRVGVQRQGMFL